jgi:hypothetical protein
MRSLLALRGVEAANVHFVRDPQHVEGLQTWTALRQDAESVTGRRGPRRAIVREILDVLAREAAARGAPYFCFGNADIIWSQQAVDWMAAAGREGYVFSRMDFDPSTGADTGIELAGLDAIAVATAVWPRIRHRFRDYLVGQMCWDNVYASVLMCHADAVIENRRGLIRHERHPSAATPADVYGRYTQLLTALDAWYFRRWCHYWSNLRALRERGAGAEAEERLAREMFAWPPSPAERAVQALRSVKARLRYAMT